MHFLFPQDSRGRGIPEDLFEEQAAALSATGYTYSLLADGVLRRGRVLDGIPHSAAVVYRGWMLNAGEYSRLVGAIRDEFESAG